MLSPWQHHVNVDKLWLYYSRRLHVLYYDDRLAFGMSP
jgi:hypothetical protein